MASMNLFIKPYQAKQAIAKLGDGVTLEEMLEEIYGDVAANLPFICPRCLITPPETEPPVSPYGSGEITNPADLATKIECPTCYGWGQTEVPITTSTPVFSTSPQPSIEP